MDTKRTQLHIHLFLNTNPAPTDERGWTHAWTVHSVNSASSQSNGRMSPACIADKPSTNEGKFQVKPSSVLILWLLTRFSAGLRTDLGPSFSNMASTSCKAADCLQMSSVMHSCPSALCLLLMAASEDDIRRLAAKAMTSALLAGLSSATLYMEPGRGWFMLAVKALQISCTWHLAVYR